MRNLWIGLTLLAGLGMVGCGEPAKPLVPPSQIYWVRDAEIHTHTLHIISVYGECFLLGGDASGITKISLEACK